MVSLGGGKVVEAGFANECNAAQLAAKITPILLLFCISNRTIPYKKHANGWTSRQSGSWPPAPLIVDAAAEEELTAYYQAGGDIVIYSGAKAIEGPTSGLVIGKKQYVEWVKRQSQGIGRAMKVGKEGILGLTLAIEQYLTATKETGAEMVNRMSKFISDLNAIKGISAQVVWDAAGRDIARTEISFDEKR